MYGGMGGGMIGGGGTAAAATTAAIVLPNTGAPWTLEALAVVSALVGTAIVASTVVRAMAGKSYTK